MQMTFVWWPSLAKYRTASMREPKTQLTEKQWSLIEKWFPYRPVGPAGGRLTIPARPCLEGLLWLLRNGGRWKDFPRMPLVGVGCATGRSLACGKRRGLGSSANSTAWEKFVGSNCSPTARFPGQKRRFRDWADSLGQGNEDHAADRQSGFAAERDGGRRLESRSASDRTAVELSLRSAPATDPLVVRQSR